MLRQTLLSGSCVIALLVLGCAGGGEPAERDLGKTYLHSYDYLKLVCREILERNYTITALDEEKRTITTDWDTQLQPMANFGERHRLIITISGDEKAGYSVSAKEEAEVNTEQKTPLDPEEAEWEKKDAGGGHAHRFLWALHNRLEPVETWRMRER